MAYTQSQLETIIANLESQMQSAASREQYGERSVHWSTAEQLTARITYFKGLLDDLTSGAQTTRFIRAVTRKGY